MGDGPMENEGYAPTTESPFMLGQSGEETSPFAGEAGLETGVGLETGEADATMHESEQYERVQSGNGQSEGALIRGGSLVETPELDPYAGIRAALSPEHVPLAAGEFTSVLGRTPAVVALHWL